MGSLIVLLVCLMLTAVAFSFAYLSKEKRWEDLAVVQLSKFFEFEYLYMSEEMWTGNVESVLIRVSDVAKKFGDTKYSAYLADTSGKCKAFASSGDNFSTSCIMPPNFKKPELITANNLPIKVSYIKSLQRYIYSVPLFVGQKKDGYLYVEIMDPYEFFTGGTFTYAVSIFVLICIPMIAIWLLWWYLSNVFILRRYFSFLVDLEKSKALGEQATQVAHDIRSPLCALEMIVQSMQYIPEVQRTILRSASSRIRDIANNLLEKARQKNESFLETSSQNDVNNERICDAQLVFNLLDLLVTEKRIQYKDNHKIQIESSIEKSAYNLFAKIERSKLSVILSNIIDNAVQSIKDQGRVALIMRRCSQFVEIIIEDNGSGIPEEILQKLGQRGVSFGKKSGSGLGVYHAKSTLEKWGGQLLINSKLHTGTKVCIYLPITATPVWFLPEIIIENDVAILILDDDEAIHCVWDSCFKQAEKVYNSKLNIVHVRNAEQAKTWLIENTNANTNKIFCLFDYELINCKMTGFDILEELALTYTCVLVTSHFDEVDIRNRCIRTGVKLLPKAAVPFVPIVIKTSEQRKMI